MSTARSLLRKIDPDVLARVLNNTPRPVEAIKRQKARRYMSTYRWYRRNEAIHGATRTTWNGIKPTLRLNYWPSGKPYKPNGARECTRRRRHIGAS